MSEFVSVVAGLMLGYDIAAALHNERLIISLLAHANSTVRCTRVGRMPIPACALLPSPKHVITCASVGYKRHACIFSGLQRDPAIAAARTCGGADYRGHLSSSAMWWVTCYRRIQVEPRRPTYSSSSTSWLTRRSPWKARPPPRTHYMAIYANACQHGR